MENDKLRVPLEVSLEEDSLPDPSIVVFDAKTARTEAEAILGLAATGETSTFTTESGAEFIPGLNLI